MGDAAETAVQVARQALGEDARGLRAGLLVAVQPTTRRCTPSRRGVPGRRVGVRRPGPLAAHGHSTSGPRRDLTVT